MKVFNVVGAFILIALMAMNVMPYAHANDKANPENDELQNLHLKLNSESNDTSKIKVLLDLCWYYMDSRTDSAMLYAKKALKIARTTRDIDIVNSASALGYAYSGACDYENAIKYKFETFEHMQKLNYTEKYPIALNSIGSSYLMLNDHKKAFEYFSKALEISKTYDDGVLSLTNLGQAYNMANNLSKALEYYQKALKLAEEYKQTNDQPSIYNRIAELSLNKKNYNMCMANAFKSLKLLENNGNEYVKIDNMRCIAECYLATHQYEKGITIIREADSLAQRGGFIDEQRSLNDILSELYEDMHKPVLALEYYKKSSQYKDSIFNLEKNKRITFLQTEFETKQKELQVENLQKEAALHRKMVYVYLFISILALTILILMIKDIVQKNKKLKIEKDLADQRLTIEQDKLRIEKDRLIQHKEKEKLEKQRLEMELDEKHREILTHAMQIFQQKEVLTSVRSELVNIINIENSPEIINSVKQLNSEIKSRIDLSDDWTQIKIHFEKVHPLFFNQLKNDYPDLTLHELKLCAYTKLKFNSKEISRLLNITPKSVQMLRYRLKKKMNIPEEENFYDFIVGFDQIIKTS